MKPLLTRAGWLLALAGGALASGCATAPAPRTQAAAPPAAPASQPVAEPAPVLTAKPSETALKALEPTPPAGEDGRDAAVIVPDPEANPTGTTAHSEPSPTSPDIVVSDLWVRIRQGFSMPDLDGDLVRDREQYYVARPDYMQRMTERASRYLFHIVEEVESRGMPTELALLPFVESAFNPQAMSVAKASGMWQFIPSTGRDFSLTQNLFRDERRDVLASTRAALDYLGKLHAMFGDWHLALAAYNWGEGSVQRAIARNRKAGLPTDYQSLRMPVETRYYVPKLQAIKNIIHRPESFGVALAPIENHPYFLTVAIQRDMDVALAIRLAGLERDEFRALNPQMNQPVILAAGTSQILLPYDNARRFMRNLTEHRGPLASWTAWVVPRTMRPAEAAKQAGMSEAELREINKIPPRMLIKAGSTLLVERHSLKHHQDVSAEVADNAIMSLAPDTPPLRRTVVRAGARDTVGSLARRYGVSPAQLVSWNKFGSSQRLKRGQQVVVYTPAKRAVRAAAADRPGARKTAARAVAKKDQREVAGRKPAGKASRVAKGGKTAVRVQGKSRVKMAKN
ncbi:transglycosylase SLT domain-containing protein [Aquabacterium sp. A7-Y]|uniref:transglycosylase SLT domain-containing protein n=1 Tax=Aquabacterium sp. A7-Y TaxID=1349605 RepID=UPI00223DC34E|nr:transglycosylase SLT domain-containing protein [Aquabacterium sp. A7-Y]MCW7540383.1 transglycosylase SLT domain-containing protein [Aquabacterium sp. A7-Y]